MPDTILWEEELTTPARRGEARRGEAGSSLGSSGGEEAKGGHREQNLNINGLQEKKEKALGWEETGVLSPVGVTDKPLSGPSTV